MRSIRINNKHKMVYISGKKIGRYSIVSLFVLLLAMGSCRQATEEKGEAEETENREASSGDEEGFVSIFDGESLKGWEGDTAYWSVEDGNLVGQITPEKLLKTNSFIVWQGGTTGDFELKTEFRITEAGNSGRPTINRQSFLLSI